MVHDAYLIEEDEQAVLYFLTSVSGDPDVPLVEKIVYSKGSTRCISYSCSSEGPIVKEAQKAAQDSRARKGKARECPADLFKKARSHALESLEIEPGEKAVPDADLKRLLTTAPPPHVDRNLTIGEL